MNTNNIIKHICSRLNESKLESEPWPHKFIEDIFPEDFYKKIIQKLPSNNFYKSRISLDKNAQVTNYSPERHVFQMNIENLNSLDENDKSFWYNFFKDLCSEEIQNSVLSIFKNTLDNRMKNLTELEKSKIGTKNYKIVKRGEIVKDFKKYHLGAHTDTYNKLITFLFYLPLDNSLEKLGTSIFKSKNDIKDSDLLVHQSKEETEKNFIKIKTCKFIPNSLLIFPRTNSSFHGVDEVNENSSERDLFLFNYYIYGDK